MNPFFRKTKLLEDGEQEGPFNLVKSLFQVDVQGSQSRRASAFLVKGVEDFMCDDCVLDVSARDRGSLPWGDEFREENFEAVG